MGFGINMKYIVTGGCGFICSNLVEKLINLGHEVTIFDDQILEENRDSIYSKVPLLIDAEIRKDAEMERITALKICTLEKYLSQQQSKVTITVQNHQILNNLKMLIKKSSDNSIKHAVKLKLRIDNKEVQIALPSDYYLDVTHEQFAKLPADTLSIY